MLGRHVIGEKKGVQSFFTLAVQVVETVESEGRDFVFVGCKAIGSHIMGIKFVFLKENRRKIERDRGLGTET